MNGNWFHCGCGCVCTAHDNFVSFDYLFAMISWFHSTHFSFSIANLIDACKRLFITDFSLCALDSEDEDAISRILIELTSNLFPLKLFRQFFLMRTEQTTIELIKNNSFCFIFNSFLSYSFAWNLNRISVYLRIEFCGKFFPKERTNMLRHYFIS